MDSTPPRKNKEPLTNRELNAMIARRSTDPELLSTKMLMTANNVAPANRRSVKSNFKGWHTPTSAAEMETIFGKSATSNQTRRSSRRSSRRNSRKSRRNSRRSSRRNSRPV